jgi:hypothetical protein
VSLVARVIRSFYEGSECVTLERRALVSRWISAAKGVGHREQCDA